MQDGFTQEDFNTAISIVDTPVEAFNHKRTGIVFFVFVVLAIIAGGILVWQFWPEQTEKTEQIPIIKPEVPVIGSSLAEPIVIDETFGWQTYRNEQYGFEMKYPDEWIEETETVSSAIKIKDMQVVSYDALGYKGEVMISIGIFVLDNFAKETLSDFAFERTGGENIIPKRTFEINGLNAVQVGYDYSASGMDVFEVLNFIELSADKVVYIQLMAQSNFKDKIDDLNEIISTFQYDGSVAGEQPKDDKTADWKTYNNSWDGFRFRYPEYFDKFEYATPIRRNSPVEDKYAVIFSKDQVKALPNIDLNPSRYLMINIFHLSSYVFNNSPNAVDYGYDISGGKWWQLTGDLVRKDAELDSVNGDGWEGVVLGIADMSVRIYTIAIPNIEKNIMVEISVHAVYPPEQEPLDISEEDILSELKDIVLTLEFL